MNIAHDRLAVFMTRRLDPQEKLEPDSKPQFAVNITSKTRWSTSMRTIYIRIAPKNPIASLIDSWLMILLDKQIHEKISEYVVIPKRCATKYLHISIFRCFASPMGSEEPETLRGGESTHRRPRGSTFRRRSVSNTSRQSLTDSKPASMIDCQGPTISDARHG